MSPFKFRWIILFLVITHSVTQMPSKAFAFVDEGQILREGLTKTYSPQTLSILGLGGVAATIGSVFDQPLADYFAEPNRLGPFRSAGNFWGTGIPGGTLAIAQILLISPQQGLEHVNSLILDTALIQTLKLTISRKRPDLTTNDSFPSGHTSCAFTTAGHLWHNYGPIYGSAAVLLGTLTAASRMASNRHYFSDTIFGATLGWIIGWNFSSTTKKLNEPSITYLPYFSDRKEFGLLISRTF